MPEYSATSAVFGISGIAIAWQQVGRASFATARAQRWGWPVAKGGAPSANLPTVAGAGQSARCFRAAGHWTEFKSHAPQRPESPPTATQQAGVQVLREIPQMLPTRSGWIITYQRFASSS